MLGIVSGVVIIDLEEVFNFFWFVDCESLFLLLYLFLVLWIVVVCILLVLE